MSSHVIIWHLFVACCSCQLLSVAVSCCQLLSVTVNYCSCTRKVQWCLTTQPCRCAGAREPKDFMKVWRLVQAECKSKSHSLGCMKQSLSAIHTLQILCGNLPCRRHANKLSDMSANLDSHLTCNRLSRLNWFGFNRWFEAWGAWDSRVRKWQSSSPLRRGAAFVISLMHQAADLDKSLNEVFRSLEVSRSV